MKKTVATLVWVAGLCLAGADGHIAINFIGLSVFLFSSMFIVRLINVPDRATKKCSVYGTRKV